jgi:hypothetical protein
MRSSRTLDELSALRATMVLRDLSTEVIDKRIAAERVRIERNELDKRAPVSRAATMEISAERKAPEKQSVNIIYDASGKAVGYKAPTATYFGTPKMPLRNNLKK